MAQECSVLVELPNHKLAVGGVLLVDQCYELIGRRGVRGKPVTRLGAAPEIGNILLTH